MKLPKDIEELKRFFKVFSEPITEPCYQKPKKWTYALGLAGATLIGAAAIYFGMYLPAKNEVKQKNSEIQKMELREKNALDAKNSTISSLEQNLASAEKEKTQANATIKSLLSVDKNREISRLSERISKLTEDFDKYRKDYPETLLREKSSLEARLAAVQKEVSEAKNYFAEYAVNHPGISTEEYNALLNDRKKLEQAQSTLKQVQWEFEDYKKSHSDANFEALKKEKEGLWKRCTDLEARLNSKYEHSFENCLVYRDQKTNAFFIYFDVTYDTTLPPESVIDKAGDWAGPKRVGRYITREQAGKLNVWSTLGKEYKGDLKESFDKLWVALREQKGKVDYFLVVEGKPTSEKTASLLGNTQEVRISEEQIKEFVSSCLSKR